MKKRIQGELFEDDFDIQKLTSILKDHDYQSPDFWEYCDNCGEKLLSRKCELICPKCGFFHSCSEP